VKKQVREPEFGRVAARSTAGWLLRRNGAALMIGAASSLVSIQGLVLTLCLISIQGAYAETESAKNAAAPSSAEPAVSVFSPMSPAAVREQFYSWVDASSPEPATRTQLEQLWSEVNEDTLVSGEELLDLVIRSSALVNPDVSEFLNDVTVNAPESARQPARLPENEFIRQCIRLFEARWLAQHRYYDESLEILNGLSPESSIDPATLFFYRAVCQRALNQHQDALNSLTLLLSSTLTVPQRFQVVGNIMLKETKESASDGLPAAARLMSDVQRRLDLGRSGEKVQQQEGEVISLLDKMLEDMERQSKKQSGGNEGQGGENGGQQGSATPSGSSRVQGSAAEGEADRKELKDGGSWGMLDQKTEARARQLIRQNFPPNYLDAISRYTKKIAEQK
jgi:hypothetical protein